MKLSTMFLFLCILCSAADAQKIVDLHDPLQPPPNVSEIYVHIIKDGFRDYNVPTFWAVHFEVIPGPTHRWPKVYQKVIATASKPGEVSRQYMIVYHADLTKFFTLSIVGPSPGISKAQWLLPGQGVGQ